MYENNICCAKELLLTKEPRIGGFEPKTLGQIEHTKYLECNEH